jgi:intracellular septation protein A
MIYEPGMNKKLLQNITFALLPIIAYIIADTFFEDSFISIIIAIGISIIEFIVTFVVYKKADAFIFFDLLLIGFMGGISIALKNPVFFKLKPAIIEIVILISIAPICFSEKFFAGYISRYLKDIALAPAALKAMQRNMRVFLPVILVHVILIIIAALFFSKEIWAFTSSFLLYIFFGIYFIGMFVYGKLRRRRMSGNK